MTSSTVDSPSDHNPLPSDSLPLIDLRLLSQSELYSLSLSPSSPSSSYLRRSDGDVLIPKIDRSVFNESAGSRKQTFSRLRLAPRNSQNPSASSSAAHIPRQNHELIDEENAQIIRILRQLFGSDSSADDRNNDANLVPVQVQFKDSVPELSTAAFQPIPIPIDVVNGVQRKRKRGRPRKNESMVVRVGNKAKKKEECEPMVMVNGNGVMVDVSALANLEDPFGKELRRRTEGMETESQLLGFLGSLNGEWGSRRKKRRIVLASDFGDILPSGWKIMLSLKRRAGRVWLFCRRYLSPNGHQFVSCKEVSSYLISFFGLPVISQTNSSHADVNYINCGLMRNICSEDVADGSQLASTDYKKQSPLLSPVVTGNFETADRELNNDYSLRSHRKIETNPCFRIIPDANSYDIQSSQDELPLKSDKDGKGLGECSDKQDDFCNLTNNELADTGNANVVACKSIIDDIVVTTSLTSCNSFNESFGEINDVKHISNGIIGSVGQEKSLGSYLPAECGHEKASSVETARGASIKSEEECRQKTRSENGKFVSNCKEKTCTNGDIENRQPLSSLEDVNISAGNHFEIGKCNTGIDNVNGGCSEDCVSVSSGSDIHNKSGNAQSHDSGVNSENNISSCSMEKLNSQEIKICNKKEPLLPDGSGHVVTHAGVGTSIVHEIAKDSGSIIYCPSGFEQSRSDTSSAWEKEPLLSVGSDHIEAHAGVGTSTMNDIAKDSGNNIVYCPSSFEQRGFTTSLDNTVSDHMKSCRDADMISDVKNHVQNSADCLSDLLLRSNREDLYSGGITNTSSVVFSLSECLPISNVMADKGEYEEVNVKKFDDISITHVPRVDSINFLNAEINSDVDEPKVVSYDVESMRSFDSSVCLEKEDPSLSSKIDTVHLSCDLCRNELHNEAPDTQPGMGSLVSFCESCKEKFPRKSHVLSSSPKWSGPC